MFEYKMLLVLAPYTQINNALLGEWRDGGWVPGLMTHMCEAELKVILACLRLTQGFHRTECHVTHKFLVDMTGLSKPSVIKGVRAAIAHGLISEEPERKGYRMKLCQLEIGDQNGKESLPDSVKNVYPIGKESLPNKETLNKEIKKAVRASTLKRQKPADSLAVDYLTEHGSGRLNSVQRELINAAVRDVAGLEKWRKVVDAWLAKGYSPRNVPGMLEWQANGGPPKWNGRASIRKVETPEIDMDVLRAAIQKQRNKEVTNAAADVPDVPLPDGGVRVDGMAGTGGSGREGELPQTGGGGPVQTQRGHDRYDAGGIVRTVIPGATGDTCRLLGSSRAGEGTGRCQIDTGNMERNVGPIRRDGNRQDAPDDGTGERGTRGQGVHDLHDAAGASGQTAGRIQPGQSSGQRRPIRAAMQGEGVGDRRGGQAQSDIVGTGEMERVTGRTVS
jgi:hypothetical protein